VEIDEVTNLRIDGLEGRRLLAIVQSNPSIRKFVNPSIPEGAL